jgi:hypothetical protein
MEASSFTTVQIALEISVHVGVKPAAEYGLYVVSKSDRVNASFAGAYYL